MLAYEWGSIGYPKREKKTSIISIDLQVATPLFFYLATPTILLV